MDAISTKKNYKNLIFAPVAFFSIDEATLKKVNYNAEKNTLVLSPANAEYEPFVFVGDEISNVRILGRAVAFTSAVRQGG